MSNPFGVPPVPVHSPASAANPFDPLAAPPADPFATAAPLQPTPTSAGGGENPFASPDSTAVAPPYGSPFASPPPAPVMQHQQQQPSPAASAYETAMVPSQYQTNPYGGMAQPPVNNYQWGLDASAAPSPYAGATGSSYADYPAGQQQPPPQQQHAYDYAQPPPPSANNYHEQQQQMEPHYSTDSRSLTTTSSPPKEHHNSTSAAAYQSRPVDAPVEAKELRPNAYEYGQRELPSDETRREDEFKNYVNPYRGDLAREAPHGSSPLPKPELVRKKGYVLSRISFRTIVMKKWKQSYWVQYGPHTMLWFRNESDFSDWLNNPYHDQATRNFLIKLAVNFVHDLYKPNVRGYQVTQCRTKAYGNKMVRQFKLERWMDYGPTIAAAFGSYDPKEVDDLRAAIVECMRNTPLNSGIRATGAVRQHRQEEEDNGSRYDERSSYDENGRGADERMRSSQASGDQFKSAPSGDESVGAAEEDLLDVNNWDDVPTQGPPMDSSYSQQQYPPNPYGAPPAYAQPQGHQQYAPQHPQPQQPGYNNAMVPFAGAPSGYPGAPPPQPYGGEPWAGQAQQYPPPQQQQAYAAGPPPPQYNTPAY